MCQGQILCVLGHDDHNSVVIAGLDDGRPPEFNQQVALLHPLVLINVGHKTSAAHVDGSNADMDQGGDPVIGN